MFAVYVSVIAVASWRDREYEGPFGVPVGLVIQLVVIALVAMPRWPRPLLVPLGLVAFLCSDNSAVVAFACYCLSLRGTRGWPYWLVAASVGSLGVQLLLEGGAPLSTPLIIAVLVWLPGSVGRAVRIREERRNLLLRNAELRAAQAAARERATIQRELHDTVAHGVTLVMLQAGALEVRAEGEETRQRAIAIQEQAQSTLEHIQEWYAVLRASPGSAEATPPETIAELADLIKWVEATGTEVSLIGDAEALRHVGRTTRLAAYRIVQEALTNAAKHAPGASVEVGLRDDGARLFLQVCNAPAPPAAGRPVPSTGLGLDGLRERARLVGGTLRAGPYPDGGFHVHATLPKETQ